MACVERLGEEGGVVKSSRLVISKVPGAATAMPPSIRTLMRTSVPEWSWNWSWTRPNGAESVDFITINDRSIDVILNNERGEGFVKQVFLAVLLGCSTVHAPPLVLDIGANVGYYSMLSAAHGCAVLAVDAQPGCAQWFESARAANAGNVSSLRAPADVRSVRSDRFARSSIRLVTRPISSSPTPIEIDAYSCWVMHKTDIRLRRRRRKRAVATVTAAAAGGAAVPADDFGLPQGRVAALPLGARELIALTAAPLGTRVAHDAEGVVGPGHADVPPLAGRARILLAKVDVEGAELGVLRVLAPLLPQIANLVVEIAPGWWPLYANRSGSPAATAASEAMVRVVGMRDVVHRIRASEVAAGRRGGAGLLARLLTPLSSGGAGFAAALTSTNKLLLDAAQLRAYVLQMGGNGYWNQEDVWFARDATSLQRARRLICLRRRTHRSEAVARKSCDTTAIGTEPRTAPHSVGGGRRPRGGRGRGGRGRVARGRKEAVA